ncbi:hypothetical protein N7486_011317 [Penicillium sp. IBT 16267x]|nr:hypothetical protein N7486_011317 [Penicillium sp. IBT 16267x]
MRLHLVISRHGLPVTRILWTTTAAASLGEYGTRGAAPTSAIASSRNPNVAFSNGGYTVSQLLEDVNEVVPLETEPSVFDPEFSGQWGLEDYVVEVGGSECLHFMEVDGLLREGDEVVIRALQLADLRARRLCGRIQIATDGKHLIDGVPFGAPFIKRSTTSRPAITIPPRKKRRTVFSSGWDQDAGYACEGSNTDEEGDGEWLPPTDAGFGKELSILPVEHDMSMGTVIRHPLDHSADDDSDDVDEYEPEEDELESELKALKEDFEEPASQFIDIRNQSQQAGDLSMGRPNSAGNRPGSANTLPGGSLVGASSLSSKRSRREYSSPRASKAVRFNRGENVPQSAQQVKPEIKASLPEPSDSDSDSDSGSDSGSDSDSDTDSDSDSGSDSSDDASTGSKAASSSEEDSDDEQSNASSSSSSDSSSDDSSSEEEQPAPKKARRSLMAPPGHGTIRTKKSNTRYKLRRRLSKLKEIGVLPDDADFAALRTWEEENGGWHCPEESSIISAPSSKEEKKKQHQMEFEAKRQQLLRDLAACGIDVEGTSEKENVPPRTSTVSASAIPETAMPTETKTVTPETERSNRRTLDIASSRRLLFGSLGVRTPKTKEDEEATIQKLAAQASKVSKKPAKKAPVEKELPVEEDSDVVPDWQDKLIIKATECFVDGITLTAPPFPFKNRWDAEAGAVIRERLGWNKKRKRRQRIQVYDGAEEGYEEGQYGDGLGYQGYENYEYGVALDYDENGDVLHYDEEENEPGTDHAEQTQIAVVDDLPVFPSDPSSVADLLESEAKPGAIVAFRQLDMSKETNWQPRMSEYRVAQVQKVDKGIIHVRLAVRDWKPKQDAVDPEDDGPRQYSGFEMPGFDDEEGEDDGLRELAYAELSDPKLLQPAPCTVDDDSDKEKDKGVVQEDSIVSVVADSMPNAQLVPPLDDMDLDETTFVTLVTANESPRRLSDVPSIRTPGGTMLLVTQGQDADDEQSDTPVVPSPSFSGFHSALSSPGMRLRFNTEAEEGNLDGHTLVGEAPSIPRDVSNQDISALSFLSANESIPHDLSQLQGQHDRQVVEEPQIAPGDNGSGPDSLLSQAHNAAGANSYQSRLSPAPARGPVEESPDHRTEPPEPWEDIVSTPSPESTDQEKDEVNYANDDQEEDKDSLLHSNQSVDISPHPSPPPSSSRSSHKPPPSAQPEPHPQKSHKSKASSRSKTGSPAGSVRSKRRDARASTSQINSSQMSEVIDLTSSPAPTSHPTGKSQQDGSEKPDTGDDSVPARQSKMQRMTEVSVSPKTGHKKSKKRLSRKF